MAWPTQVSVSLQSPPPETEETVATVVDVTRNAAIEIKRRGMKSLLFTGNDTRNRALYILIYH